MADEKIRIIVEGVDRASSPLRGIGKAVLGIGAAAAGVAAGALVGIGAGLISLAKAGEPIAGITAAFEGFTQSVGVGTGEMLTALQSASGGLISNTDLMRAYNEAIQLVGPGLANNLAPAMQALGRVSAATGQDMGFLLNSLVTGVGRLSPMILDNLGIQVDLNAAYEDYAAKIGKAASELSKEEQQAALTAQVIQKLGENTANLPDPSGGFAAFRVTLTNLRDTIATAVLPIMTPFINALGDIVNVIGGNLLGKLEELKPIFEGIGRAIGIFFENIMAGQDPIMSLNWALNTLLSALGLNFEEIGKITVAIWEFYQSALSTIDSIVEMKNQFIEFIQPLIDWVTEFVSLKDVLIALGLAVAAVLLPAIGALLVAAGQIALIVGGLIAAIAVVRTAWETDWMGIRTAAEGVASWFVSTGLPNIKGAIGSMQVAAQTFSERWQDTFKPNIEAAVSAFIPLFETVKERVKGAIDIMMITAGTFADRWQDTWLPNIKGALEIMGITFNTAKENVKAAIDSIAATVRTAVENITAGLRSIWTTAQTMANNVSGAFNSIVAAIDNLVAKIGELIQRFTEIVVPDILTPGSPTPFELGLRGITSAIRELSPELDRMNQGIGGGTQTINHYNLTLHGGRSHENVAQDFRLMEAASLR